MTYFFTPERNYPNSEILKKYGIFSLGFLPFNFQATKVLNELFLDINTASQMHIEVFSFHDTFYWEKIENQKDLKVWNIFTRKGKNPAIGPVISEVLHLCVCVCVRR